MTMSGVCLNGNDHSCGVKDTSALSEMSEAVKQENEWNSTTGCVRTLIEKDSKQSGLEVIIKGVSGLTITSHTICNRVVS